MAAFRAHEDRADFFDFGSQILANDMIYGGFGSDGSFVSRSSSVNGPGGPQAIIDTVPGDTSTTAVLTVGAAPTVSGIDSIGDQDFYQITLVAGHIYAIGMYGTPQNAGDAVGPNGVPLLDSFIELYDSAGNLITSADGGSDTTINAANSGFDALLTFTATTSGTYYVNARAFDNVPADGDNGDMIGDYGLYAQDVTDAPGYVPYYDANSPLYAIDWGTMVNKVHQTYRNPDGNEGTHVTGNPQSPVDPGAAFGHPGKNVISIYFAVAGDVFVSNDPTNPGLPPATITATGVQQFEHDAVMTALAEFAKVADVVYVEVNDRSQADFIYTSYAGTPGPGVSLLGSMSPPDESDEGLAQFNSADYRWNATDLQQGGFSFTTLIHEFGHGHGLAHPHDNGGHSGIMHGVEPEGAGVADYTTGDFHLNQAVFTMMSYEDGWQDSPYGNAPTSGGYGYLGSLMAFDIAAIQDKYGVNEEWATGDDVYTLNDVNAPGTYYRSIWDAGGTDSIVYAGARNATIDLRPATLQYEEGGGGWVSFAFGIYGGFTIANGVTIENATSGSGNDTLIGNNAANILDGGTGTDQMTGLGGNDWFFVRNSADQVYEEAGGGTADRVFVDADWILGGASQVEIISTTNSAATVGYSITGNALAQTIYANNGNNIIDGGGGGDVMIGFGGNDWFFVRNSADRVYEEAGGGTADRVFVDADWILGGGSQVEIISTTNSASTIGYSITGNALAQTIYANNGNNIIDGGGGGDVMIGFGGDDWFFVRNSADRVYEEAGGGTADRVFVDADWILGGGSQVEIISTTNSAATVGYSITGNALAQTIYANNGNNTIDGGGGGDVMIGFGGDDWFFVRNSADRVYEEAGGGTADWVFASTSWTMNAGSQIEIMSTTLHAGTTAIDLTGNELAQTIYGNEGANRLDGAGGNDTLRGGGGADVFAFTSTYGAGNVDTILDFEVNIDKIGVTGVTQQEIANGAFRIGNQALDADDRVLYDQASGALLFDADGNGAGAAIQFAAVLPNLSMTANDFMAI